MRGRRMLAALGVMLITSCAIGAPAWAAVDSPAAESRISGKLAKRVHNPRLGTDVAVAVIDATSNREVYADDADAVMRPASNMKIVTAVTALATLGADTRFSTRVFAGETPNSLIVQGGGDPLLTSADLRSLADRVATRLTPGTPVVIHPDLSRFTEPTGGPGWTSSYVPQVVAPVTALARLGDYAKDPAGRALHVLATQLRSHGLQVRVGDPATPAADATAVAEVSDHTVADAVGLMLRESENNIAEVLYRQVAVAKGQPGTFAGGRTAARAVLTELGIDPTHLKLMDGSGVSRADRLTARTLTQLLRLARVQDPARFAAMFVPDAMPISGVTGTLDSAYGRFTTKHSKCAKGAIRAKTGTLFDTIGLSGLTTATDGQEKIFAILVNHRPARVAKLATRQAVDGLAATVNGCW